MSLKPDEEVIKKRLVEILEKELNHD